MTGPMISAPEPFSAAGNAWENWEIFHEQWENNKLATGLTSKDDKTRVVTLKALMGWEYMWALRKADLLEDDKKKTKAIPDASEEQFKPRQNVMYKSYKFNTT